MSVELDRLNKCLEHTQTYFEDNYAMMGALALILKRQECVHKFGVAIEEGKIVRFELYDHCTKCGIADNYILMRRK